MSTSIRNFGAVAMTIYSAADGLLRQLGIIEAGKRLRKNCRRFADLFEQNLHVGSLEIRKIDHFSGLEMKDGGAVEIDHST
jgi:hypothetical protein